MNKSTAQRTKPSGSHMGSTQKFIELESINEDIVILRSGGACLIVEVQASNFALLSSEEQDTKIYAYASMLNSLSHPIQILIRNKKIDISQYINLLNAQIDKATSTALHPSVTPEQNQSLVTQMQLYRDFIQELVKVNEVLDKKFYIILTFSALEQGVSAATNMAKKGVNQKDAFFTSAKANLHSKAESLLSQLDRMSLRAKILDNKELIQLFYDIYNHLEDESTDIASSVSAPIIRSSEENHGTI